MTDPAWARWNLAQLIALVYVSIFVPVRVAWANEPRVFSAVWFIELAIDCYFLAGDARIIYCGGSVDPCAEMDHFPLLPHR